jgi:AraC-like DNA-binding protein
METISPVYARLLVCELERRDIDASALFAGTSLSRNDLLRGGDISMEDFLRILQTGDRLLGNSQIGFMLGRRMNVFAMGPVGSGLAVAPSLREGLQLLESFSRLHVTYIHISARSTLQGLTVTILYGQDTGLVERFHTETAMMLLQQYMETLIGEPIVDAQYRLAIPKPKSTEIYTNALHGQISFDAPFNEVDIPLRLLDLPSAYYHAEVWRQAQMSLSQSLKEQSQNEGKTYTQHIAALLRTSPPPLPELSEVAFTLHISERTLNRRLQVEGTGFRQLKSLALASRAKLYLRDTTYSVESIAEEMGYKDTANFRRAFRKCEGCSPIEYRQSKSAAGS